MGILIVEFLPINVVQESDGCAKRSKRPPSPPCGRFVLDSPHPHWRDFLPWFSPRVRGLPAGGIGTVVSPALLVARTHPVRWWRWSIWK